MSRAPRHGRPETLALMVLAAALALSFAGAVISLGDSLAVGRLWIGLALLALALWSLGRRRPGWIGGLAVLLGGAAILPLALILLRPTLPEPAPDLPGYALYQKNTLHNGWPREGLVAEILGLAPDFVTLQEVHTHNRQHLAPLFAAYPERLLCDAGVVILSRHPFVPGTAHCSAKVGMAMAQVALPDGAHVWLASLHQHWPFPFGQSRQLDNVLADIGSMQGPVILGGDLNMVPWGHSVRAIIAGAGAVRAGPPINSYPVLGPLLPLPIDHVLLPDGAAARMEPRPLLGSDHIGLWVHFTLPQSGPAGSG